MTLAVHMEITGSSASAVKAARETQAAIGQVAAAAKGAAGEVQRTAQVVPMLGRMQQGFQSLAPTVRNASYQIADFATQVAAGGSPAIALAQQLPQLAAGFGAVGAAVGALLAVGIPLAAVGFRAMMGETRDLDDLLDGLAARVEKVDDVMAIAGGGTDALIERYGEASAAVRSLVREMADLAMAEARQAADELMGGVWKPFLDLAPVPVPDMVGPLTSELRDQIEAAFADATRGADRLQAALGSTQAEARAVQELMVDAAAQDSYGAQADALAAVRAALKDITDETGRTTSGAREMATATVPLEDGLRAAAARVGELESGLPGVAAAIGSAAAEAGWLADNLGRAVGNALAVAAAASRAASDAQLQLKYEGDAAGRAGARFDRDNAGLGAADPTVANVLHQARMKAVSGAYDEEKAREELAARRKAEVAALQAASGSGRGGGVRGGGGGGGGIRAADEAGRGRKAVDDLIASLQAELDVMREADPYQQEMIRLRERMTHATVPQREAVESLVRTQIAETAATEAQIARMDSLRDVAGGVFAEMRDGMLEGAKAGEILGSVLGSIGDRLLDLAGAGIGDILFGKQGSADGGALGGVLGGFLSNILPFAQGGVVDQPRLFGFGAGRVGLMGEAGPEAIMPLSSGMVGASLGGRETRLPLTRLSSGNLGVAVTPFARGGVVTAGPLARGGGVSAEGGRTAEPQRIRLELALSPDVKVRFLEEAQGRAELLVGQAEKRFDATLPGKVRSISGDPSYVGRRGR